MTIENEQNEEVKQESKKVGIDEITKVIFDRVPEVNENAINQILGQDALENESSTQPSQVAQNEVIDDTVFNPDIHAVDDTGNPKLKADGKTYQKKRGRKAGSTVKQPVNTEDSNPFDNVSQLNFGCDNFDTQHEKASHIMYGRLMAMSLSRFRESISDMKTNPKELSFLQDAYSEALSQYEINTGPKTLIMGATLAFMAPTLGDEKAGKFYSGFLNWSFSLFGKIFKRKKSTVESGE